jgi:hypothetical protein
MESVLQCDTFSSFDSLSLQNDAFSSILEDFQDRTQLDFGFSFPSESLEFTETSVASITSQRRPPGVGEKRKIDSMENFWDSDYFLPSNDCNFVNTYSSQDDYSYPSATENFDFNNKVKTLDSCFGLEETPELCTVNHVHKKQKIEAPSSSPIPNISSPPFSQRPNSSPTSPQKLTKRRSREVARRSSPIPILCPDASLPTSPSNSLSSDPTLIPNVFEFKKTISELDDTTRTVYRDTLLQLARNAESGVFEPSNHNNGMNFESLLMRMMFSFSVPSISPSFFSTSSATSNNVDRSHLLANQSFYNNLQFVPIISSRPPSNAVQTFPTKIETSALPHRADPFFQKGSYSAVPNFALVKPFSIPIPTSASANTYSRGATNDSAKQPVISRHLPIRVL